MFEMNKENMKEKLEQSKAERIAHRMFNRMLSESLLESDAPEYMKLSVRVMDKTTDISDAVRDLCHNFVNPIEGIQANAETLAKVLEYLELVEVGIKQFVETTPFVAHTEEDEDDAQELN